MNHGRDGAATTDAGPVRECNNPLSNGQSAKLRPATCIAILLVTSLLCGMYCVQLGQLLYKKSPPIFDSMSYHEKLHRVISVSRSDGISEGMLEACFNSTTVCGPFIIAALLAPFVEPTRAIGTWIQIAELALLLFSLFYYLKRVENLRSNTALFCCLAFFTLKCLFYTNGGLSDFRMDLSLMLMFGSSCVWLVTSLRSPKPIHFAVLGLVAGITCLFRATAPIYLVFAMAPICAVFIWCHREKVSLLCKLSLAAMIAAVTAIWFYFFNMDFLYYYYVVWNTDANANVEFWQSLTHLTSVQKHIGWASLALFTAMIFAIIWRHKTAPFAPGNGGWFKHCRWEWLFIGIAPILILAIRGAGPNVFVSMPAVVGLLVFAVVVFGNSIDRYQQKSIPAFLWMFLALCICGNSIRAFQKHEHPNWTSMDAHQQIIDVIASDARREGRAQASFGTLQLSDLNTVSLYNTVLFDRDDVKVNGHIAYIGQVHMLPRHTFTVGAVADWEEIDGQSTAEKIDSLCQSANAWADYLLIADSRSSRSLRLVFPDPVINHHISDITAQLVKLGSWRVIGPVFKGEHDLHYRLYKNVQDQNVRLALRQNHKPNYSNDVGCIPTGNSSDIELLVR